MDKLYLLSQSDNNGYDTYDSAVVSAPDAETARWIHPDSYYEYREGVLTFPRSDGTLISYPDGYEYDSWAHPSKVTVKEIGITTEPTGVILASFNAG